MSGTRALIAALFAGLLAGFLIRMSGRPDLLLLADALRPLGTLWLNALKMTLVPLIFAMVATGISSLLGGGAGGGRLFARTIGLFAAILAMGAAMGLGAAVLLIKLWPLPANGLVGLLNKPAPPPVLPPLVDQIVALIPVNPVAAAANGEMLPLVIFAFVFGLAMTHIARDRRETLTATLGGIADVMMKIVDAVLKFSAVGVFVLALNAARGAGVSAATMLAQLVFVGSAVAIIGILFSYLVVAIAGRGVRAFAAAAIAPQAMAAGTTSSMATLPAMIEAAENRLGLSPALAGAVLPLAVSSFRLGTVMMIASGAVFAAAAAGVHPSFGQYVLAGAVIILSSAGAPGLPAAALLYAADAPAFQALGAPIEFIPLLIAVSAIPDILTTMTNVTADLMVALLVSPRADSNAWAEPAEAMAPA